MCTTPPTTVIASARIRLLCCLLVLAGAPGTSALGAPVSPGPGADRGPRLAVAADQAARLSLPASALPEPAAASWDTPPLFVLAAVRFEGGEGLQRSGLPAVARAWLGRAVSLADLEQLRYALTKNLVDQGYINSGVILKPAQVVTDGVVTFQIITGRLSEIRISGHEGLDEGYLRARLWPDPQEPLHRVVLQQRFQRLLDDPLIEHLDGTLLPGLTPGSAVLDLKVVRARPWSLYARVDNYHPPSTGAEFFYLGGTLRNLTGFGDALEFAGGVGLQAGGGLPGRGWDGSVGWSIPVTASETRAFARYDRTNSSLLEEPIRALDIASLTQRLEIGLSHPWWRTQRQVVNLGILGSWSENTTTLLGEPFSFSPGAVHGQSRVSAVRLYQEYLDRRSTSALGLRSVFSLGVDAFGATVHGRDVPDGQSFIWLGQAQYVRELGSRDTRFGETQLVARAAVQLTPDLLLPLERYAVGGAMTVRGYRENELIGDSGYVASLELRLPLWRGDWLGSANNLLQGAIFVDVGSAWGHGQFDRRQDLVAAGLGLRLNLKERVRAECYWAHAFTEPLTRETYDWQDDGIHFMVEVAY